MTRIWIIQTPRRPRAPRLPAPAGSQRSEPVHMFLPAWRTGSITGGRPPLPHPQQVPRTSRRNRARGHSTVVQCIVHAASQIQKRRRGGSSRHTPRRIHRSLLHFTRSAAGVPGKGPHRTDPALAAHKDNTYVPVSLDGHPLPSMRLYAPGASPGRVRRAFRAPGAACDPFCTGIAAKGMAERSAVAVCHPIATANLGRPRRGTATSAKRPLLLLDGNCRVSRALRRVDERDFPTPLRIPDFLPDFQPLAA